MTVPLAVVMPFQTNHDNKSTLEKEKTFSYIYSIVLCNVKKILSTKLDVERISMKRKKASNRWLLIAIENNKKKLLRKT